METHIHVPFVSPGRVVDILGASGASDPGSNPGRGVLFFWVVWGTSCWHLIELMNRFCVFDREGYRMNRSRSGIVHPFYCIEDSQSKHALRNPVWTVLLNACGDP